jgi:subtilisin family serine protease
MKCGERRVAILIGCIVLSAALLAGISPLATAQDVSSQTVTVGAIEIKNLVPFEVTFQFRNATDKQLERMTGKAVLTDRLGTPIEDLTIDSFSVAAQTTISVTVTSRWEFQELGIYLLQISLDAGLESLISKSLAFRIVPINLPLAPPKHLEGEGLYTVHQQPVNWGISEIKAPTAWQTTHGTDEVVVAVIDSGIDTSIPELARSMWTNRGETPGNGIDDDKNGYIDDVHGWDFRDNDNSSLTGSKLHWHGTFVASIIASWPDDKGIVGVAPGAKLMDLRFLDSHNLFYGSDWKKFAEAIDYAVDNGADIINMSVYANGKPPSYFEQAVRRAAARGVVLVGIAGNDGKSQVSYPAKYPSILAVSAIDQNERLASFSNYGPEVEITAPGAKITALFPGGIAGTSSGTSFAAPHVCGVLALILSAHPGMKGTEAVSLLEASALDLGTEGRDYNFGYGLINAAAAVSK